MPAGTPLTPFLANERHTVAESVFGDYARHERTRHRPLAPRGPRHCGFIDLLGRRSDSDPIDIVVTQSHTRTDKTWGAAMGETRPAELQRFYGADPERLPHGRPGKVVEWTIAELADALDGGASIGDVLTTLISAAVALVSGASCAKISVIDDGRLCSIAATSQLASSLDSAQQAAGQGPCLDAISAQKLIRCDDLGNDGRWPRFADTATTTGVRSVLTCPMDIRANSAATFSLFAFRAHTFGIESEAITAVLADHAAIALVQEQQARQFQTALASRDVIGQAKGMIMERFGVDASRAFAMLTTISQESNTPVRDLAAKLVDRAGQ